MNSKKLIEMLNSIPRLNSGDVFIELASSEDPKIVVAYREIKEDGFHAFALDFSSMDNVSEQDIYNIINEQLVNLEQILKPVIDMSSPVYPINIRMLTGDWK